jgi:CubicO group peptidase (beta-lactamase class C family)
LTVAEHGGGSQQTEFAAAVNRALSPIVDQGAISGAAALLWREDGTEAFAALGRRDLENDLPMTRDAIFRIASMTKPVTSALALMLLEDGALRLEDPIARWIPELAAPQVLLDPAGPLDRTSAARRPITIEDLLTHRAGLGYSFTTSGPIAEAYFRLVHVHGTPHTPDSWLAALGALPLCGEPGEQFHYGYATDVLGFLMERALGRTLREIVIERIFDPLGMADTDFWLPTAKRGRLAVLYQLDASTQAIAPAATSLPHHAPVFCAGGDGLVSTVDDFAAFARMLLAGGVFAGRRILREDSIELMTRNCLTEAQRADPFMGMPFWRGQGFGLGVSVILDSRQNAWMGPGAAGAYGWPGVFGTWWRVDPQAGAVLVCMMQNAMPLAPGTNTPPRGRRLVAASAVPAYIAAAYRYLAAADAGPPQMQV